MLNKFQEAKSDYLGQFVVTPEVVAKKIKAMKDNKSHGVDGIPPKEQMEIVEQISIPLAFPSSLLMSHSFPSPSLPSPFFLYLLLLSPSLPSSSLLHSPGLITTGLDEYNQLLQLSHFKCLLAFTCRFHGAITSFRFSLIMLD